MDTIQVEEIARELGIKSRELIARIDKLSPEAFFSLNIKSGKSLITVEIAERLFDAVMGNKKLEGIGDKPIHHQIGKINFSFAQTPLDIDFIKRFASIYKTKSTEHFMVRSFNFSEMDIVRCFTAGLIGIDVARYLNNRSSKEEINRLIENLHLVLDDIEVENIDDEDPLENLEEHIKKHKPEVVYLEGLEWGNAENYVDIFQRIGEYARKNNTKFEINVVNMPIESSQAIDTIVSYFK